MTTVILCTDGSELSTEALRTGLPLLRDGERIIVATVVDEPDSTLVTGASGFAGGAMSPVEFDELQKTTLENGARVLEAAQKALGLEGSEGLVLQGQPGPALCALATEQSAGAIVMGTRGRGGVKRALLGSVSDYVVRNAPCSVMITRDQDA